MTSANSTSIVVIDGLTVRQDKKGRYSLNDLHRAAGAADRHRPSLWAENQQAKDLIAEIESEAGIPALVAQRGGKAAGTYVVKELVYAYAMWISPSFSLHIIRTFDRLANQQLDWRKLRSAAASTNKVVNAMLQDVRAAVGKATEPHHYMTEAKLVNWAHSGEFTGMERDTLDVFQLELLAFLELKNAALLGRGVAYADRKPMLKQYAMDWRLTHAVAILPGAAARAVDPRLK